MQQTLYRFGTYRNHKQIEHSKKETFYVLIGNNEKSSLHFLPKSIRDESITYPEAIKVVKSKSKGFNAKHSIKEIREIKTDIYNFSSVLIKNKISPKFKDLKDYFGNHSPSNYNSSQLITLWDNLFYYLFVARDKIVVDQIISLLVANNFIKKFDTSKSVDDYTENDKYYYTRLLKAKIILPIHIKSLQKKSAITNYLSPKSKKDLLRRHNSILLKCQVDDLLIIKDELKNLEKEEDKKIRELNEKEISNEKSKRDDLIKTSYLNYDRIKKTKLLDNITFKKAKKVLTENIIKSLESRTPKDVNVEYMIQQMKLPERDFKSVYSSIDLSIKDKLHKAYKPSFFKRKYLTINGFTIQAPYSFKENSFVFQAKRNFSAEKKQKGQTKLYDIFFTQYYKNEEDALLEITGKIITGKSGKNNIKLNATKCPSVFKHFVTFKLNETPFSIPNQAQTDIVELSYINSHDYTNYINLDPINTRIIYPTYGVLDVFKIEFDLPERKELYGITSLGINDFRRIDQEICCYVKGEVSHIENVMAAEYKEKTSRNLTLTESSTEETEYSEREISSDTTTADRFEMQSEVSAAINEEKSKAQNISAGVSGSYPGSGITFNASGSADWSSSSSFEESTKEAITEAHEVTEKIKDRLLSQITKKRSFRMKKEYEEINKHGFDNRGNEDHVVGIYRWIDKIYDNYLVNYGKRLMYEFMVPQPGKNFVESLVLSDNDKMDSGLLKVYEEPIHPNDVLEDDTFDVSNIDENNYSIYAATYQADIDPPPKIEIYVSKGYASEMREHGKAWKTDMAKNYNDFEIPEGYYCDHVYCKGSHEIHGTKDNDSDYDIVVADKLIEINDSQIGVKIQELEGFLPVGYRTRDVGTLSFNIIAKCTRKDEHYIQWQTDAFNSIMSAYLQRKKEYNQEILESEDFGESTETREHNYNPKINRRIEQTELKRLCIEMMTAPFNLNISQNHYGGYPMIYLANLNNGSNYNSATRMNLTSELDLHAQYIEFFEEAFEWEIMAYNLFPYFYAQRSEWFQMMHNHTEGTNDELFKAFLSSGMAKIKVPVRRGYENAVQFFIETGEIWKGGGFVLDSSDDLHISVNEEMATAEEVVRVEEKWQSKIPTALTIVQADGSALEDKGLPCNCIEEPSQLEKLAEASSLLKAKKEES